MAIWMLTPGDAEGSKIRIQAIDAEEVQSQVWIRRVDADEIAAVAEVEEDRAKDEEEEDCDEGDDMPRGSSSRLGHDDVVGEVSNDGSGRLLRLRFVVSVVSFF